MGLNSTRGLAALIIAALPLAGLTATFSVAGADAVYAGNGNGNGGGNDNGGNRGGRSSDRGNGGRSADNPGQDNGQGRSAEEHGNGRGAVASELKGLNACHASDQARASADPESQVGRIAAYASAAEQTETARADWSTAKDEYDALLADYEAGRTSAEIQLDIDGLDPASESYQADLAALEVDLAQAQADEAELQDRATALNDTLEIYEAAAEQERTALSGASGGRELSDEAKAALRSCLDS